MGPQLAHHYPIAGDCVRLGVSAVNLFYPEEDLQRGPAFQKMVCYPDRR